MLDCRTNLAACLEDEIEGDNTVSYPVFFDLSGKRCVVVGGGAVANRKARKLLQARAEVVVISPDVMPELESMAVEVRRRPYETGDLDGAFIAFAATSVRKVNAAVAAEAKAYGIPVNVADAPEEGDFTVPSTLRRGRLQVAVSTGGASPALARRVRARLEEVFGPEWAGLIEEVGTARRAGRADEELEEVVDRCLSRLRG